MQLLVYFAAHAGRVISRTELEENIWGRVVGEDALTNTISKLRRTFIDDARNPKVIETVPKTGYRLIAEVNWNDAQPEPSLQQRSGSERTLSRNIRFWIWLLLSLAFLLGVAGWLLIQQQAAPKIVQQITDGAVERKPSVAIIPFENLDEKPGQEYFANGITVNLITDLAKISGLLVIAPGSAFVYQSSISETRQISRELDVDYIVRGSVQRQDDRLQVNVQLIEAAGERALWAERYNSEMGEIFELQDQVVTALVAALRIKLAPNERDILKKYPIDNVEAYDLFLRGMEEYGHRTPESNRSAREHYEQAIALVPDFARAIAGLALVHSRDAIDGWTETPRQSMALAEQLAEKAAAINPSIPQVHFVTGQVALFNGQHAKAIEATKQAIAYSPNYADAYAMLAWIMNFAGHPNEALSALETAVRLNPIVPASYSEILGEIYFVQGKYVDAIDAFNRALNASPLHMRARMWLIVALAQIGNKDEMTWQKDELAISNPGFSLKLLEYAFPYQEQSIREKLMLDLRKAGLPE